MSAGGVDDRLYEAMANVGDEIGPNIAVVVPPERKDVDPLTLLIAFGGYLLAGYLKGVKDESRDESEAAGRATVRWLRDKIAGLFDRGPDQAAAESSKELQGAVADLAAAPGGAAANVQAESARQLIEECLRGYGMSPKAAGRAARTVQLQAVTLVVPVEQ